MVVLLLRNEDRCSLNPAPPDPWGPGNDGRRFTLTVAPRGPRYPPSDHSAVEPCHRKPGTLVAGSVDLAGLALRLDSLLSTGVSPLQCQGKRGAMATCIPAGASRWRPVSSGLSPCGQSRPALIRSVLRGPPAHATFGCLQTWYEPVAGSMRADQEPDYEGPLSSRQGHGNLA